MEILIPALILAGIGFVMGTLIYIVGKVFYVEENPAIDDVVALLPKYNCGACGYPGCKEMAQALLAKNVKPAQCKPMKKEDIPALESYLKTYFEKKEQV